MFWYPTAITDGAQRPPSIRSSIVLAVTALLLPVGFYTATYCCLRQEKRVNSDPYPESDVLPYRSIGASLFDHHSPYSHLRCAGASGYPGKVDIPGSVLSL